MVLKLYNTLTRKKEIFEPINKKNNEVKIYSCGPTVYYYAHIGNFRAYVFSDTLKRVLELNGFKIKGVMNLTDVGHLTSDEDEGEDKILKEAKKQKKSPEEIANYYTEKFFEDFDRLNNKRPEVVCKATEHINEMIKVIEKLENNGYTYLGKNGNVYFDTSKFKNYGKLAKLNLECLKAGARIKIDENKKNPRDFVLWFAESGSKFKGHVLLWDSPWGKGWPGWHIECSAMSMRYLGETLDIHAGGEDHIPVHHTNEIAQSEGATGKIFSRFWMHVAFLQFNAEKMSKSKGGILMLSDLIEKGYSPMDLRYFYLSGHYKKPLNFTFTNLNNSKNTLNRLREIISTIKETDLRVNQKNIGGAYNQFLEILNDDLNTPKALSFMWEILRENRLNDSEKYALVLEFDKAFGLKLDNEEIIKIPKDIEKLVHIRELARKNKDWKTSDELREKIKNLGYSLDDTKSGTKVKKFI